jgi:glucokinase
MRLADPWAIGVDLGGTKIEVARVTNGGKLLERRRRPTQVEAGPDAIIAEIAGAVKDLIADGGSPPLGVGVGLAGQIDPHQGVVRFAPNLRWQEVPFQEELSQSLRLPVVVTNDVRAATWGEWLHGAGMGCDDLVCLFAGTGIGGGVVSGGKILSGCSNTAGELGHMTIDLNGPPCTCGNRGCLEALAGGWAIALHAKEAVNADPEAGAFLLRMAGGGFETITAKIVAEAAKAGDPLARRLVDSAAQALTAGAVSLINAFNPCRLILGGGVIEGLPYLVDQIDRGIRGRALPAATELLQVLPAELGKDAGVIGAAMLVIRTFKEKDHQH